MTVVYRALWQTGGDDPVEQAATQFIGWLHSKDLSDLDIPEDGEVSAEGIEVAVRRGQNDDGSIGRWVLREEKEGGDRWVTTMTVISPSDEAESWFWIDVENVSTNFLKNVEPAAPRLVSSLFDAFPDSHRGNQALIAAPVDLLPDQLDGFLDELIDVDRDLPVVVFGYDSAIGLDGSMKRSEIAARRLAGLCRVYRLGPLGEQNFASAVGPDLAVWGGSVRVYLPGVDPERPSPGRHRYFLPRTFGRSVGRPGKLVANYLSALMPRQRPPRSYLTLRPLIDAMDASSIDELWGELESQLTLVEELKDEKADDWAEKEFQSEEIDRLQREYQKIWVSIREVGVVDEVMVAMTEGDSDEKDWRLARPETCADAIELANVHLCGVAVHPEAGRKLEVIDQAHSSSSWIREIWKGLVALSEYAQRPDEFSGDFWIWCETSGSPFAWYASDLKLAMTESDDTVNRKKFLKMRTLPVDKAVHAGGVIRMLAHLKIETGGGNDIPRVYFHDDTRGPTGKVHVGLIGPHYLVKNSSA